MDKQIDGAVESGRTGQLAGRVQEVAGYEIVRVLSQFVPGRPAHELVDRVWRNKEQDDPPEHLQSTIEAFERHADPKNRVEPVRGGHTESSRSSCPQRLAQITTPARSVAALSLSPSFSTSGWQATTTCRTVDDPVIAVTG